MTLRRRLLLLVFAVLLPTAGLFIWIIGATYERENDMAEERLRDTARALSLVVDRELDKRAAIARTLASSPDIERGDLHTFYDLASFATQGSGNWAVLVDGDDQVLNTSVPFGTPLPRRGWKPDRPLAQGDRIEVSNLRTGPLTGQPVLAVFAAVRRSAPARYNVGIAFTPAALQNILVQQGLPAGWIASVLDREHVVVARSPQPERWIGRKTNAALTEALARRAEGFVETESFEGSPVLAFYSRSPVHGWTFVIGVPRRVLATAARSAAFESGGAATLLALFALGLAAHAARGIRRPIVMLEQAARQLERDEVPDLPPTGLVEADAVGAALRRAGMQAALDLTERAQALDELRRTEEEQRLLVQLHDATRGLRDPAQVQWEIVRRVGQNFRATRCIYAEIDAAREHMSVGRDYTDGVQRMSGVYPLDMFGAAMLDELAAGRTVIVSDVRSDPRTANRQSLYESFGTCAMMCVPLLREGRWVALLAVHQREPRGYSASEAALLEQVAERTWFALERARAEAALRESRDVLALAMRSGKMGAWSRDLAGGRVWWSREFEELFGLPPGGFGDDAAAFTRLVHPDDRASMEAAVAHAIAHRTDYAVEFRFRHASGEWRWMEGRGRAVIAASGRPTVLYGVGMDVTARKHADEELRRLNAELSQAHRRKDEFLATLAHELRNPLAPITNAVEIMRLREPADVQMRWTRDVIDRQVRQMTRLVDDLLDVARITSGKIQLRRERVALSWVVHAAVEAARPFIDSCGHALAVDMPAEPLWLHADPTRLTQVVLNLLNNAAKYTPRGGHIRIAAAMDGHDAVIRVRDDGVGIAPEQIDSVFEMFAQLAPALERSQGGLGIGLALARGLVELHGGSIHACSAGAGQGSEFTVRLPLAASDARAASIAPPPDVPAVHEALRVLVVDDNVDAAESLAVLLEHDGHAVAVAHDGREALDKAPSFAPDVVLLDIGMPVLNGYQVAERLRRSPGGERYLLVALTGWGHEDDKRRASAAGFDLHLTKPVDPAVLDSVIEQGHARRRAAR